MNIAPMRFRQAALTVLALSGMILSCGRLSAQTHQRLSAAEVDAFLRRDTTAVVLDVRTPEEFTSATGHLKGARLIPVQDLESRVKELNPFKKRTIVVYCYAGPRSERAAKYLTDQGFKVISMKGGMSAWNRAGLPVEKGPAR